MGPSYIILNIACEAAFTGVGQMSDHRSAWLWRFTYDVEYPEMPEGWYKREKECKNAAPDKRPVPGSLLGLKTAVCGIDAGTYACDSHWMHMPLWRQNFQH